MKLEVINEPIVLVRELYNATTKGRLNMAFREWCITYLRPEEQQDFILLGRAIKILMEHFMSIKGVDDWVEQHYMLSSKKENLAAFEELKEKEFFVSMENDALKKAVLELTKEKYNLKKN